MIEELVLPLNARIQADSEAAIKTSPRLVPNFLESYASAERVHRSLVLDSSCAEYFRQI